MCNRRITTLTKPMANSVTITIIAGMFTTLNTILGIVLTQWRKQEVIVDPAGTATPHNSRNPG